jgi:hypothetical protein
VDCVATRIPFGEPQCDCLCHYRQECPPPPPPQGRSLLAPHRQSTHRLSIDEDDDDTLLGDECELCNGASQSSTDSQLTPCRCACHTFPYRVGDCTRFNDEPCPKRAHHSEPLV